MKVFAHVLRVARQKKGKRRNLEGKRHNKGPIEFAQAALMAKFPNGLPEHNNWNKLTVYVQGWLDQNPDWQRMGYGPVTRSTVRRAGDKLRTP